MDERVYRLFTLAAFLISVTNFYITTREKLAFTTTGLDELHRSTRDLTDRVECTGDEILQITSTEGTVDEKLVRIQCTLDSMKGKLDITNEDLTNALFYTNDLAGKVQKVEDSVEENSRLLESQLEYLQDAASQDLVIQPEVQATPTPALPSVDTTALKKGVADLNRTLNAWVSRSVMAYESQGRLSALASAERRGMMERIVQIENAVNDFGPVVTGLIDDLTAVQDDFARLSNDVISLNETLAVNAKMVVAPTGAENVVSTTVALAKTTTSAPVTEETTTTTAPAPTSPAAVSTELASDKIEEIEAAISNNLILINGVRSEIDDINEQFAKHASEKWYNAPNGYQYYLSVNAFRTDSYARSRRYCQYRGGDLAYVGMRDEAVYRFLWNTVMSRARILCIWIGLTDMEVEGTWKWIDGQEEEDGWTNWRRGYKGRSSPLEDCASIRSGIWHPTTCSGVRQHVCSFVCERKIFK